MKIPIFLHHHIASNNYTPENFELELKYLYENGYKTLSLTQLSDFLSGKKVYPKSVMITFDDGYADNYICAYPILKKYGYNAVIFLTTFYITDGEMRKTIFEGANAPEVEKKARRTVDEFLRWSEIRKMVSDGSFEIGSHTHTHRNFNRKEKYKNLEEELLISKKIIKEKLNIDIIALAWPWGEFDKAAIETAKKIEYKMLFTTITGGIRKNDSPFLLKRIDILPDRNLNWFKKRLKYYTLPLISDVYPKIYGLDRKIKNIFKKQLEL